MNPLIQKLFYYECWAVAWRVTEDPEYPKDPSPVSYAVVPMDSDHWAADPFLISDGTKTFLFFEYMPFHSNRASIACCEMTESGPGPVSVALKTDGHLSYPAVFRSGKDFYMIPETLDTHAVSLYRADPFPAKWTKVADLLPSFDSVDSTPVIRDGKLSLFLYDPDEPDHKLRKLYLSGLSVDPPGLSGMRLLAEYPEKTGRPAGTPFTRQDGTNVRPTQDSRLLYGGSIRYLSYSEKDGVYTEKEAGTLSPSSIQSDLPYKALGIHTVSRCGKYEAIDLFYRRFSLLKPVKALIRRLSR